LLKNKKIAFQSQYWQSMSFINICVLLYISKNHHRRSIA
jgi:hypothetical protein